MLVLRTSNFQETTISRWVPRQKSHILSPRSMIVRVSVVLRRTVCGDINWRFVNLSGSHPRSQVNYESSVDVISLWSLSWSVEELTMLLVVCQLSRDVIGCEDCKTTLVLFDMSFFSQMSLGLLLVKLVGLSIVCLFCWCCQQVVCKVQLAVGKGSVVFVLS